MKAAGYADAEVQKFTNKSIGGNGYQISTKTLGPDSVKDVERGLDTKFGNGPSVPGPRTSPRPRSGRRSAKPSPTAR